MTTALKPSQAAAWRGFLRTHALLWRELEASLEEHHGLTLNAYDVLVLLDEAPGGCMRMTELAQAVLMSSGGFTRLADRMQRDGLIERRRCATDGRGFDAFLTPAGRKLLEQARRTHRADVHARFLDLLDESEQAMLGKVWERLQAR